MSDYRKTILDRWHGKLQTQSQGPVVRITKTTEQELRAQIQQRQSEIQVRDRLIVTHQNRYAQLGLFLIFDLWIWLF